jgi:hypothetical protein
VLALERELLMEEGVIKGGVGGRRGGEVKGQLNASF